MFPLSERPKTAKVKSLSPEDAVEVRLTSREKALLIRLATSEGQTITQDEVTYNRSVNGLVLKGMAEYNTGGSWTITDAGRLRVRKLRGYSKLAANDPVQPYGVLSRKDCLSFTIPM